MSTFVLVADTANGVQKIDMVDFLSENPDQEFVQAKDFIDYLKDLEEGETVAALFDPLVHAEHLAIIEAEYGVH